MREGKFSGFVEGVEFGGLLVVGGVGGECPGGIVRSVVEEERGGSSVGGEGGV